MKLRGWLAAALVIGGGLVFANRGCLNQKAPDEKLADHFASLCDIARANVDSPQPGVHELGRYLIAHTGDMMGELGDTVTTIERISDDGDHDARARLAHDRLAAPLQACENDWLEFAEAVTNDPGASESLDRGAGRLLRTLEILIDGKAGDAGAADVRRLPAELERVLDSTIGASSASIKTIE